MPRLFIAAWPDATVTEALRQLPRPAEVGVRWVPERNWHVTLRFLGECSIDEVCARLDTHSFPAAGVTLGPQVVRLDRRQVVVPADGVASLARAVDRAVDGLGAPRRHDFVGHLTVGRTAPDATSALIGHPIDVTMSIRTIALVASKLPPTGAEYRTIATYPT